MNNYPSKVEKILVENGFDLKTEIYSSHGPGNVYESRVVQEVVVGNYAAAVYESGSIDTSHQLVLINMRDRVAETVKWHTVSTPSCHWGEIKIVSLKEKDGTVVLCYKIKDEAFREKYKLEAETKIEKKVLPKLTKIG